MGKPLRAVVVEDTAIFRKILSMVIEETKGIELVGEFQNGRSGLDGIRKLEPDVVLLDVEMPEMNGIEVLKAIKQDYQEIGVIMVSGADQRQADNTVKALQLGAIDFIPKPAEKSLIENVAVLKRKIGPLINVFYTRKNLDKIKQITQRIHSDGKQKESTVKQEDLSAEKKILTYPIDLVAIGTSTGGPYALGEVIPKLPSNLEVPVVVVQHMPPNFTASLANTLCKKSNVTVVEAKDGDVLEPGKVYIAPGGRHMIMKNSGSAKGKVVIRLDDSPPQHGCRPSVDVLFKSIADNFQGNVLAVVMTGMGSDGTEGVRAMKKGRCYCLIQDEASCVVFGMPKVVFENKLADEMIPLSGLAGRINELVRLSRQEKKSC